MQSRGRRSRANSFVACTFALVTMLPPTALAQTVQTSQQRTAALQSVIDAAKAEGGRLDLLNGSVTEAALLTKLSEGMSRTYGLPVRLNAVPGPTPSALAPQLVQEYKARRPASTDIFLGDDVNSMVQIEANSVLDVDWKALDPTLSDQAIGPKGEFLRLASRIIGCVWYNTNLVAGDDIPRSLQDVLNPKWKGRIASTSFIAGFREAAGLFGKDKEMVEFLRAFQASGNLAGFIRGGAADRIASGEYAMMVVAPGEYPVVKLQTQGAPVAYTVVKEIPYISYWVMNVPKNSAHPNLAKLVALYLSTREGQDLFYDFEFYDLHFLKGSRSAEGFRRVFQAAAPEVVTNEILTAKWKDYERTTQILARSIRGGR